MLLLQEVKSSTLVTCPGNCSSNGCSENFLFELGDQRASDCSAFRVAELARRTRELMKLNKIGWICSKTPGEVHVVPAVGGDPQDCPQCGQTFNDQIVSFIVHRLGLLRNGYIDNTANFYWNHYGGADNEEPAPLEYSKFLKSLSCAHEV